MPVTSHMRQEEVTESSTVWTFSTSDNEAYATYCRIDTKDVSRQNNMTAKFTVISQLCGFAPPALKPKPQANPWSHYPDAFQPPAMYRHEGTKSHRMHPPNPHWSPRVTRKTPWYQKLLSTHHFNQRIIIDLGWKKNRPKSK